MTISEFIAQLQLLKVQHGDLEVWIEGGIGHPHARVEEMLSSDPRTPPTKIVLVR